MKNDSTRSPSPSSPQAVEQRARAIWEEQGRPHGRSLDHWLAAEREIFGARESQGRKASPAEDSACPPREDHATLVATDRDVPEPVRQPSASKLAANKSRRTSTASDESARLVAGRRGSGRAAARG